MFPRDMVCLRNISVDTLHKGDIDNNNNNNNNNNNKDRQCTNKLILRRFCVTIVAVEKQ